MKYKLTDETTTTNTGIVLHRIECVTAFSGVKVGEKGGWIEREENISQCDNCWVYGDAFVYGNARVCGDALVCDNAQVYGNARVYGDALVYGDTLVCGNAHVYGNARVYEDAHVYGNARVYGDALVCENAKVCGNALVCENAKVCGNAVIGNSNDYIVFKNNWSSGRYFTWTSSNDMWKVGCFYGTGKELIEKAYKDSKLSGDCYKAYVELVEKLKEIQK